MALASHHGIALVSLRDQWDVCEVALRATTDGHDREIQAAVDALRYGIVADLVAWRVDGATRVERELSRRLADRAGIDPELARWAIDAWAFAFKIPLSAGEERPASGDETSGERGAVVIRARHLVLVGAFAGLAAAVSVVSGSVSRLRGSLADTAAAAPAPRQRPQAMAVRTERQRRVAQRPAKEAQRPAPSRSDSRAAPPRDEPRRQLSLGDVVTRMPPMAREPRRTPAATSEPPRSSVVAKGLPRSSVVAKGPPRSSVVAKAPPRSSVVAKAPPRGSVAVKQPPPTPIATTEAPRTPTTIQAGTPADDEPSCAARRPRLVRNSESDLSAELQSQGVPSGRVVVRFRIDEDGYPEPGSARVVESSNTALNANALQAVERSRYESARAAGCTGPATIERTIRFF